MNNLDRTIRGYELKEEIGKGGFGAVYLAYQPLLKREVAIKIILPKYANQPEFIRQFEVEAELVARLEHPHIVPLFDYWREPDSAFLVMRYLRGGNLETAIKREQLSTKQAIDVLIQIANALHVAHTNNVVHRDIKPANILLDEFGNAYLSDFGIAKRTDYQSQQGEDVGITGSIPYISPEQLQGTGVSAQTDVYALGIVLYEMLTGEHPFGETSLSELVFKHLQEDLPSLADTRSDLPEAVNEIIQQATHKDKTKRFSDVRKLAKLLRGAIGHDQSDAPIEIDLENIANPYRGLRAFEQADAANFFGRKGFISHLLLRLSERDTYSRFLAVIGPSGSGKSSAVKAGLIPALMRGDIADSGKWFVTEMVPSTDPMQQLETALLSVATKPPSDLGKMLSANEDGLLWAVDRVLADHEGDLLLLIDQFEELFTLTDDAEKRRHFMNLIYTAVTSENSRLRVIITVRADLIDKPLEYMPFGQMLRQRMEFMLPMSADEIEQSISGPARRVGLQVDPDLIAAVVADVQAEPGALPLLQYALTEVFERKDSTHLTLIAYRASGGVTGALARRAEDLYENLTPTQQDVARQLFLRLVVLGDGTDDTRRRTSRPELIPKNAHEADWDTVIDLYGRHRLLTFDRDFETRLPTVEIAHEALIRTWQRLRDWLNSNRDNLRIQRRLNAAAREWQSSGKQVGFLASEGILAQFESWAKESNFDMIDIEAKFLEASLAERTRQTKLEAERIEHELSLQKQATGRLRLLVGGLAIFLIVAVGLSLFAFNQSQRAEVEANRAEQQAMEAVAQADIALVRANEAQNLARVVTAQQSLSDDDPISALPVILSVDRSRLSPHLSALAERVLGEAAYAPNARLLFTGHDDRTHAVDFSPDGTQALSASRDAIMLLWNVSDGEIIQSFVGHEDQIADATYHPDGQRLISVSGDGKIIIWDIESGEILHTLEGHEEEVSAIAVTPDGNQLLSGSRDSNVILWDIESGEILQILEGHEERIERIDISPDGTLGASTSRDDSMIIWDLATGESVQVFDNFDDNVTGVAFSPDGSRIVAASDVLMVIWDIATGDDLITFRGHGDNVVDVEFSPDGRFLLSGSDDTTLILWDANSGTQLLVFNGHSDQVNDVDFSPDGTQVLSASDDGVVFLWDLRYGSTINIIRGFNDEVGKPSFMPNDEQILSVTEDTKIALWDVETGEALRVFETDDHEDGIEDLALNADGTLFASADGDGIAIIWDMETGEVLHILDGHDGESVEGINFSPDSRYVLTASDDALLKLWDVETGEELRTFEGHEDEVTYGAFSPDGSKIVSSSEDELVIIWDVESGEILHTLEGHDDEIEHVIFSPDGSHVLSVAADRFAIYWDVETGEIVHILRGHLDDVRRSAITSDGRYALTASEDRTVRVWNLETGLANRIIRGHLERVSSVDVNSDGSVALTSSGDGSIILHRMDTTDEILSWIDGNRYLRELTCAERDQLLIEPLCEEDTD